MARVAYAYEAVQRFYDLFFQRDAIAYWYGAKGETLSYARMEALVRENPAHFARYDKQTLARLMQWSAGKRGFDCSGLVSEAFGLAGWSSWGLITDSVNESSVKTAKAGAILWKPGHVGIDLGFGACGHIAREGETIRIDDNGALGFTKGAELSGVDYRNMYNF